MHREKLSSYERYLVNKLFVEFQLFPTVDFYEEQYSKIKALRANLKETIIGVFTNLLDSQKSRKIEDSMEMEKTYSIFLQEYNFIISTWRKKSAMYIMKLECTKIQVCG